MLIIFYILLMLKGARCTEAPTFELKTVRVGDDVNLTCTRRNVGTLFWMRLVSGNFPEVLGKTSYILETVEPRITVSRQPGTFDLLIKNAQLSDTAVYICLKTQHQDIIFLIGTTLKVKGPETDMTAAPPSDPVHPGDSVTIQCSVSENETYPEENSVCCFRAGFNLSPPSFNYTQGNTVDGSKNNPVGSSAKNCVFSLLTNASSSGAGTYCCSNRSNTQNKPVNTWDCQRNNTIVLILGVALANSLIVIVFLISLMKPGNFSNGKSVLLTDLLWTSIHLE
ncbi:uncharacterized protein [Channa argus]|uniref:uncharacterized protein n=1 Tax=Channa argus TaxID=215402 RepID=UPI0035202B55